MKKLCLLLTVLLLNFLPSGCTSSRPEYFEELTEVERANLLRNARIIALQGKAMPEHLRGVFVELAPYERIVYDGNKRGKATFRWEIYENTGNRRRITQKDVNPYWIMVYAFGDLRDPEWKLSHAQETAQLQIVNDPSGSTPNRPAPAQRVRYKR